MCNLLVYTCKPQWQMLWQMLCQFNHIYMCNLPCTISTIWNVRTVFACVLTASLHKLAVYTCKDM